jgi:hypothetical protein
MSRRDTLRPPSRLRTALASPSNCRQQYQPSFTNNYQAFTLSGTHATNEVAESRRLGSSESTLLVVIGGYWKCTVG